MSPTSERPESDTRLDLPPWVALLIRAGQLAPSADNGQPWRFSWDGDGLTLGVDTERAGHGLGVAHPSTWLAMGACCENLVWTAGRLGVGGVETLVADALENEPFALRILNDRSGSEGGLPDLGYLEGRHTNRLPFERKPLGSEPLQALQGETEGTCSVLAIGDQEHIRAVGHLVRTASEYRFRNRTIHEWLVSSLRITPEAVARGDGLDLDTLALPPGGRMLMRLIASWDRMRWLNRIGAYKLLAGVEGTTAVQCGAIISILAPSWGSYDMLKAGRLMERVWLRLNDAGLSVHPYFVLSDQLYRLAQQELPADHAEPVERLAEETRRVLGTDLQPAILLRVGRAPAEVPRSRRLPMSSVCDLRVDEPSQ